MKTQPLGLPYIDNAKAVLITLAVNLGCVFLFNWPDGIGHAGVIWDSLFCAAITTAVDLRIVHTGLKKLRAAGAMPAQVPVSGPMQKLPRHPLALGLIYAVAFGLLTAGANAAILWFFDIRAMAFAPWLVYKAVYALVLSVKITEFCIFRYIQPDWAQAEEAQGAAPGAPATPGALTGPIRNPLPKVRIFKEMYAAITGNIALNIIIGSLLGGVAARADGSVVILPTTAAGVPITGLVFGLILGILVTRGVVASMDATIIAASPPTGLEHATANKWLTRMPKGRAALTGLVCLCVMAFSAVALRAVMALFDIAVLNFYQFTALITVYAAMLGKPLSALLVRRCLQADYIRHTLRRAGSAADAGAGMPRRAGRGMEGDHAQ